MLLIQNAGRVDVGGPDQLGTDRLAPSPPGLRVCLPAWQERLKTQCNSDPLRAFD